jgi:hypothetical protein
MDQQSVNFIFCSFAVAVAVVVVIIVVVVVAVLIRCGSLELLQ